MARKYLVITERVGDNFNAYVPDLPGCAVCGDTREETKQLIQEAINLHIQGMLEDGEPVPEPVAQGEYMLATIDQG
jgi:predicted RNase H-like HicB family nuclease